MPGAADKWIKATVWEQKNNWLLFHPKNRALKWTNMLPETPIQECWENLNPCYKQDNVCYFIKLLNFY